MYNNYYPYNYQANLFRHNFRKINLRNILDGTQKTLSIINQVIPVIYQIRPLINNAKTAFRVMNAIKDDDIETTSSTKPNKKVEPHNSNGPTYFL